MFISIWFILIFCSMGGAQKSRRDPYLKITKVECVCPNQTLSSVEKCRLKPISRNVAQLSVNVTLHQRPITNCKINIDIYRKYTTTYSSFPINLTLDACEFLKNTKRIPAIHHIYQIFANISSFTHLCPYHELYVYVENMTTPYSPYFGFMPDGNYLCKMKWMVNEAVFMILNIWVDHYNPLNTFLS